MNILHTFVANNIELFYPSFVDKLAIFIFIMVCLPAIISLVRKKLNPDHPIPGAVSDFVIGFVAILIMYLIVFRALSIQKELVFVQIENNEPKYDSYVLLQKEDYDEAIKEIGNRKPLEYFNGHKIKHVRKDDKLLLEKDTFFSDKKGKQNIYHIEKEEPFKKTIKMDRVLTNTVPNNFVSFLYYIDEKDMNKIFDIMKENQGKK
jgi:hypothetical protein